MIRLKKDNGFTLLEVMIVIAIIGIAATISIYSLIKMLPQIRSNSAARQVSSHMQEARLRSVSENNDYVVQFYSPDATGKYSYEIIDDDNGSGSWDAGEVILSGDEYALPDSIRFGRAMSGVQRTTCGGTIDSNGIHFIGNKVTFKPTGRPNKNGSVYIIPIDDDESHAMKTNNWRAVTVTTNGRIKNWTYEASVENCSDGQGPWQ